MSNFIYLFVCFYFCSSVSQAETSLQAVEVEAPYSTPAVQVFEAESEASPPYGDAADHLRSTPGLTSGRMGGHGLELVLRGQFQEQINVVADGAYIYGGCPNRMDPATAYTDMDSYDEVEVVRGYQSVLYGPGASGGSLLFKRRAPQLKEKMSFQGRLQSSYDSNPGLWSMGARGLYGNNKVYVKAHAGLKNSDDYEDGAGKEVPSSFDELRGGVSLGVMKFGAHTHFSYEHSEIKDALFPGARMDSPVSEADIYRLAYEKDFKSDWFKRADWSAYYSEVYHVMDNYSLRPTPPILRTVDSHSDTAGVKFRNDLLFLGQKFKTSLEWRQNKKDAERKQGMMLSQINQMQSLLWPGIEISNIGLAVETATVLSEKTELHYGIRYDHVLVDQTRADEISPLTGKSANDLYRSFYGYGAQETQEDNLGGLLRLNFKPSEKISFYAGLSRSVRTADATERGLANMMVMMGNNRSWVGNPEIKPEKHHQLDLGVQTKFKKSLVDVSVYANRVDDFILRDSAKGQEGILINSPSATVYRNIDALLFGVEVQGRVHFSPRYRFSGNLTYTYGQNKDEDLPLAQIPPLQGRFSFSWLPHKDFEFVNFLRWAGQATRVDDNALVGSGRDLRNTSGYAVWDMSLVVRSFSPLTLTLGVSNILDKNYAHHLNRSNVLDGTELQVNEPGRSFYLKAGLDF